MRVRRSSGTVDTTANAADTGSEPALVLAKRIWQVKQGIRIEETQRHVPPSRG